MKPIKHIKLEKGMKVDELVDAFSEAGFGARDVAKAREIWKKMQDDKECKIFFGLAGAMVPGGMRQIIADLLKQDKIDVLVTTGANLTHDLIEALGESHYQADKSVEEIDDAELNKKGIDRIHNVYMKNSVYIKLEKFFEENWSEISKCKKINELIWKLGELVKDENSILRVCFEKKIPVFCPALADSGIGLMIWGKKAAGKEIFVDAFEDMKDIIDIAWTCKKAGVVYLSGGFPKNFIQQSLQFTKGASYGIQVTTDRKESGGSSGAPLAEGISWGKMKEKADFVDVFCDATIALPLIVAD